MACVEITMAIKAMTFSHLLALRKLLWKILEIPGSSKGIVKMYRNKRVILAVSTHA